MKCVAQSDMPRPWHPCGDTSLHDEKELVVAGPSAPTTSIRNYVKPESKPKECLALEYQEI